MIDLGETKATLDAVGEDTGSITQMAGKLGFEVRKNGELDYSLRANVIESVALGITDDAGDEIHYGLGASVPTMELRLDGQCEGDHRLDRLQGNDAVRLAERLPATPSIHRSTTRSPARTSRGPPTRVPSRPCSPASKAAPRSTARPTS